MKKYIAIFAIVFLVTLSILPAAMAVVASQYNGSVNAYILIQAVHPAASYLSAGAQMFKSDYSTPLISAEFTLKKTGSPTGFLQCKLYTVTGTLGLNAYPTSTLLATSTDYVNTATLTTSDNTVTFHFDGSYNLVAGTNYAIVVLGYNATLDTSNYAMLRYLSSDGNTTMNNAYYYGAAWVPNVYDLWFKVNGAGIVTPSTSPLPGEDFWDGSIGSTIAGAIGWILPLLFMFIPAFFFYKFAGAWGFFAGVNIGVILCYLFIPAMQQVWIIVVMVVVDGLLLFGKVGLHD